MDLGLVLRKLKISRRIFFAFLILSVIPMGVVGLFTYDFSEEIIRRQVSESIRIRSDHLGYKLETLLKEIDDLLIGIGYGDSIQVLLDEHFINSDVSEYEIYQKRFVLPGSNAYQEYQIISMNVWILSEEITYTNNDIPLEGAELAALFEQTKEKKGKPVYLNYNSPVYNAYSGNYSKDNILVSRTLTRIRDGKVVGMFYAVIDKKLLEGFFEENLEGDDAYIINENSELIYSGPKSRAGELISEFLKVHDLPLEDEKSLIVDLNDGPRMIYSQTSKNEQWTLLYAVSMKPLLAEVNRLALYILILMFGLLLVSILLDYLISTSISKPIDNLLDVTKAVKENDMEIRAVEAGNDELTELSKSVNYMIAEVNNLIQTVYKSEIVEKELELKALQSKINPHFIYNTLDSIRWSARKNNDYVVEERIEILSNLFRMMISSEEEVISLGEELKHAKYYLYFQEIKFDDRLNILWNVDEKLEQIMMLRLVLQPIIENAITHGFEEKIGDLMLEINVKLVESNLVIQVIDNGVGIDAEIVNDILKSDYKSSEHIALKNIDERLRLYYGMEYGLEFESEVNYGTKVTIRVPC